ncbi:oxygen-independent coproporphyrinogen III oxidase [Terrihabitans sp. B22-R8]|uniref:oxygen-independent coproporphyrinogen III oxidase n=1 Tax=Terrihabitans sp. B22-R8 TaxID=3425128 RepID=UPI00403CB9AC
MMQTDMARLATVRVPRYTSYPAATEFGQTDEDVYRSWLSELSPVMPVSLYLHVPFCEELCSYCGCNTRVVRHPEIIERYAQRLQVEIDMVADCLPGRMQVSHIHWGGGTPTALGAKLFENVLDVLHARFDILDDAEQAIEIDPRRIERSLVQALARLGVNRASLGVQTFDPEVQQAIGRVQSYDCVTSVVDWLRDAGIGSISFDLMYGLPRQTVAKTVETIAQVVELAPSRVSTFGYAHVPWVKKNQALIEETALPEAEERFNQMMALRTTLMDAGYAAVGFDHFALPSDTLAKASVEGKLRRNFQGYTTDTSPALIGFGSSAIGCLPQGYAQNTADVRRYQDLIAAGQLAVTRGRAVTDEDRRRGHLIEKVLCRGYVDLESDLSPDLQEQVRSEVGPLEAQGLVEMHGQRICLTEDGWPFARLVAAAFDAYRDDTSMRHSLAV